MKQIWMIIFMIALIWPAGVSAKIYQYVDKNGMVTFTNDFSTIPADKMSEALQYDEIQHDDSIPPVKSPSSVSPPLPSANKAYQKEALEKEYSALLKEKQALDNNKSFQKRREKRKYQNRPYIEELVKQEKQIIKRLAELEGKLNIDKASGVK
ncbi:MAG: DUF4124 domain-containing protein [Deltaproteobacteria bacterium]|jgi:hypothetical protein|nr:DUF4124 domain-containing protein [Deltaproteobacteria bacterium]